MGARQAKVSMLGLDPSVFACATKRRGAYFDCRIRQDSG
jgi:hypothetical protein